MQRIKASDLIAPNGACLTKLGSIMLEDVEEVEDLTRLLLVDALTNGKATEFGLEHPSGNHQMLIIDESRNELADGRRLRFAFQQFGGR